jgi:hypothetical protein
MSAHAPIGLLQGTTLGQVGRDVKGLALLALYAVVEIAG